MSRGVEKVGRERTQIIELPGGDKLEVPTLKAVRDIVSLAVLLLGLIGSGLTFTINYMIEKKLTVHNENINYLMCRSARRDIERIGPNEVSNEILSRPECIAWRVPR